MRFKLDAGTPHWLIAVVNASLRPAFSCAVLPEVTVSRTPTVTADSATTRSPRQMQTRVRVVPVSMVAVSMKVRTVRTGTASGKRRFLGNPLENLQADCPSSGCVGTLWASSCSQR